MTRPQIKKFIQWFQKNKYSVIGPVAIEKEVFIKEIKNFKDLDLSCRLPFDSFKKYFLPPCDILFKYKNNNFKEEINFLKQVIFGINTFDLKAILLYDQVFEKDPYYQKRRENTIIIGLAPVVADFPTFDIWQRNYEEHVLEHLRFDIFLERRKGKRREEFIVFTGSEKGQKILNEFGYKNYEHIEFSGPIKEEGIDPKMIEIKNKLPKIDDSFWQVLGKLCLECGKCSIVCPTCFCFDIFDKSDIKVGEGKRKRYWATCFYSEFSEIVGHYKFLKTTAERIKFWYEHKFVRIPDEYGFVGCVGCGRCTRVCPAGIDVGENLREMGETKDKRQGIRK